MIKWLTETIWNFIFGVVMLAGLIALLLYSGWVGIWETDIPRSEVAISQPAFKVDYRDDHITVDASAELNSKQDVTDFEAKLTLYDCPRFDSTLANCDVLGRDKYEFDGAISPPVKAGIPYGFDQRFDIRTSVKAAGTYVPKLVFADFQG